MARKNKEFSRGDKIRSELAAKGIALMDVGSETIWRPCVPVQQELGVPKEEKPCKDAEKQQQAQLVQVKPEEPLPKKQEKSSIQKELCVPKEAKPCEDAEKQQQARLVQFKREEPLPKEQEKSPGVKAVEEKLTPPTTT